MRTIIKSILFLSLLSSTANSTGVHIDPLLFKSRIQPLPLSVQKEMKKLTWHKGCPVPLNQLVYIQMNFWGYDHKIHQGALIVNQELAQDVVHIFKKLFQHKYPIQSMQIIDEYHGNDEASMAANNTSSFNCRAVTNDPGQFSQHSYGRAIDINPLINPFVDGKQVLPAEGRKFENRNRPYQGKIRKNDYVYDLFTKYGWDWGGTWYDVQDYQHFEKRANGEKRDPYGRKR